MSATSYALLVLIGLVVFLLTVLMLALFRFAAAARRSRQHLAPRGESALLTSTLEDAITKLKAQERATAARAEASEQLSSEIVANLTSGLVVVDSDGAVQIVNPAAERLLGSGETNALASTTFLNDALPLQDVIAESLRTGAPVLRRQITLQRPAGAMHLGVTVSPLPGDRGRSGAICLFTDLTAALALEEQLRFKEALARLGELTAGLAHEFRNGLATIHGYAWLFEPEALPASQRPYVEGIRAEAAALNDVVTNFLKFAKPDPLTLTRIDLRLVIQRAADDAPIEHVDIQGDFGVVDADEVLLRQAMSNLFRNAADSCNAARIDPAVSVRGQLDPAQSSVHVTVADNGPGIAHEAHAHLFQPFFTTRPGGTGLGLAIVQKILVGHNGRIAAANRSEGGAVFTLTLPLSEAAADAAGL